MSVPGGVYLTAIVHDIDDDLRDQAGIHLRHQQVVPRYHTDGILGAAPVQMLQRLARHLLQAARAGYAEVSTPFFQPVMESRFSTKLDEPYGSS